MTKKETEAINKLAKAYTDSLDKIYSVLETSAKEFKSDHVPLTLVKMCIDSVKKNFEKGLKG